MFWATDQAGVHAKGECGVSERVKGDLGRRVKPSVDADRPAEDHRGQFPVKILAHPPNDGETVGNMLVDLGGGDGALS